MEKFTTKSTSLYSAHVNEPIIIEEKTNTRRVFIADINDAKREEKETVSGTIVHQRKNKNDEWEEVESINLTKLKGGEGVKIRFNSYQLRQLFIGLQKLYKLSEKGILSGEREYIVGLANEIIKVPKERKQFIQQLIDKDFGEEIWEQLVNNSPDLATQLSLARIQAERKKALDEFEISLKSNKDENYWQNYFNRNRWIFGYGLKYCFLDTLTDQPSYGGSNFKGKGNQKGDFLLNTVADIKFTVLVEIKKPGTPILAIFNKEPRQYRNGAWQLSSHIVGAVSQMQINIKTWLKNSYDIENYSELQKYDVFTVNPKGILIIGHTKELNKLSKVETFESFRRNINNPEIITFDELFERAKFIVMKEKEVVDELGNEDDDVF